MASAATGGPPASAKACWMRLAPSRIGAEGRGRTPVTAAPRWRGLACWGVDADEVIRRLGLAPHPEGGWFRETWRDDPGDGSRGVGTAIYYLLCRGERSHWHRVDADEVWHFYAGDALRLRTWTGQGDVHETVLGSDLAAGQVPQARVAREVWQSAEPSGAWTLVGCTVTPAFRFDGFELASPEWAPAASDIPRQS
jgi:uncharacterized protein